MKTYSLIRKIFLAGFIAAALPMTAISVNAEETSSTDPKAIALLPQQNEYRNTLNLSGVWNFKADPDNVGETDGWQNGLTGGQPIAVPGSWNEQISGLNGYLGTVWYETSFTVPTAWKNDRIFVRIGAAAYMSKVYVNGKLAGTHEGGSLPYAIELNSYLNLSGENTLSVEVENELSQTRIPLGNIVGQPKRQHPHTSYDFFPYGGLQRDVTLYSVPKKASISDVTVVPSFEGSTGYLDIKVETAGSASKVKVTVSGEGKADVTTSASVSSKIANCKVTLPDVTLWSTDNPYLYKVKIELPGSDAYTVTTGVRTIKVTEDNILLNGEPIKLKGFGKHEDFPIFGRSKTTPVTVKDMELMKWCGANCFRTSHYPYDESVYEVADRAGILVIDETPAVGLIFFDSPENIARRKEVCEQMLTEMINRDKNHPSVIMWSVANEPSPKSVGGTNYTGLEQQGESEENRVAREFLGGLLDMARELDPNRPATFAHMSGSPSTWVEKCDVICLNRYYGWYSQAGDMPSALKYLSGEMDKMHSTYNRPVMLTEFGADAVPGEHSEYREMFTEEFQRDFINSYLDVANTKTFVSGMLIWNFADFHTAQAMHRVLARNFKGIFTIDRKPKMAAYLLHERWFGKDNY